MTKDSEKWLNLFLAVEDIEKIKKSFNNLTTEMLHQKIINLHNELNKKRDKNKNQALEITKLLEQKKDLQEIIKVQDNDIRMLESNLRIRNEYVSTVDEKVKELQKENSFVKSEHNKIIEKLNESRKETTISENIRYNLEKKVKEKDTIISYLESKLK